MPKKIIEPIEKLDELMTTKHGCQICNDTGISPNKNPGSNEKFLCECSVSTPCIPGGRGGKGLVSGLVNTSTLTNEDEWLKVIERINRQNARIQTAVWLISTAVVATIAFWVGYLVK